MPKAFDNYSYADAAIVGIESLSWKLSKMAEQDPHILDKPFEIKVYDTRDLEGTTRTIETVIEGKKHAVTFRLMTLPE